VYRVEPDATVAEQIDALPYEALLGYAEALGVMELAPWSGRSLNEVNPDAEVRQLVFGLGGDGLVTYLVLERDRWVDVLDVQWVG